MKFIHHSQEVNVADGVDIDVKVIIKFLLPVLNKKFATTCFIYTSTI